MHLPMAVLPRKKSHPGCPTARTPSGRPAVRPDAYLIIVNLHGQVNIFLLETV